MNVGSSPAPHIMIRLIKKNYKNLKNYYIFKDGPDVLGYCRMKLYESRNREYKYIGVSKLHIRENYDKLWCTKGLLAHIVKLGWDKGCSYVRLICDKKDLGNEALPYLQMLDDMYFVDTPESSASLLSGQIEKVRFLSEPEIVTTLFNEDNWCSTKMSFQFLTRVILDLVGQKHFRQACIARVNSLDLKGTDISKFVIKPIGSYMYYDFKEYNSVIFNDDINMLFEKILSNVSWKQNKSKRTTKIPI